jgi:hypothetical protein
LTHAPALALGDEASQAPPAIAAKIAAPDHFPMLLRNKRRDSTLSAGTVFSLDDSLVIAKKSFAD